MKRKLILAVLFSAAPGLVHASGVISCGGTSPLNSSTTCSDNTTTYGSILETFSISLQWNGPTGDNVTASPTLTATNGGPEPLANGSPYATTWDAVGLPLSVSGSDLELVDNYQLFPVGLNWASPTGGPAAYGRMFNSQTNSADPTAGSPGDYLIGSTNNNPITIASTTGLSEFGFRISSQVATSFDVVIQLYGINGNAIGGQLDINNLSGGGQCAGLSMNPPQPCNTAPLFKWPASRVSTASLCPRMITAAFSWIPFTTPVQLRPSPLRWCSRARALFQ